MPSSFGDKYRAFMSSRNGADALSRDALVVAFVLIVVSLFVGSQGVRTALLVVALVLLGLGYFRMFSSDLSARRSENERYQAALGKLKTRLAPLRKRGEDGARAVRQAQRQVKDREHRYFSCPKCGKSVRVPKGAGKIRVTCPACGEKFERKA